MNVKIIGRIEICANSIEQINGIIKAVEYLYNRKDVSLKIEVIEEIYPVDINYK